MASIMSSGEGSCTSKIQIKKMFCQECQERTFQYQCPRCNFRSCSLACCVAHKERRSCNGKRDRAEFHLVRDMTDDTLQSDYHFLEDVLRTVESGKRHPILSSSGNNNNNNNRNRNQRRRVGVDPTTTEHQHVLLQQPQSETTVTNVVTAVAASASSTTTNGNPNGRTNSSHTNKIPLRFRKFAARARDQHNITILYMPLGMKRHMDNKCHIQKKDGAEILYWSVEWRLHHDDDDDSTTRGPVVVELATVAETAPLQAACQALLEQKKLTTSAITKDKNDVVLLIKKPHLQNKYVRVNMNGTLQEALRGMTIIEFPTLEVVPRSRLDEFSLLMQEIAPLANDEVAVVDVTGNDEGTTTSNDE